MKPISLLIVAALLAGCATPSTMLVNDKGQYMRCASMGAGLVGMSVATMAYNHCVDDAKSIGFKEVPKVAADK